MRSGVIGRIDGQIDTIQPFSDKRIDRGFELYRQLEVRSTLPGPKDREAYYGRAAIERVEETDHVKFIDGEIVVTESNEKSQLYTDFLFVPNLFMIVESGRGEFAFDLLEEETDARIERAEINLYSLFKQCSEFDPNPWKIGFYENEGQAEKGVVYGREVLSDSDLGKVLKDSKKNQIGLELSIDDSSTLKITVTRSGYVRVYQPGNYDKIDFINFVNEFIEPNIST